MDFMIVREIVDRLDLSDEEKDRLAQDIVVSLSQGCPVG